MVLDVCVRSCEHFLSFFYIYIAISKDSHFGVVVVVVTSTKCSAQCLSNFLNNK